MEAVIQHSGRQFKVREGITIEVDLTPLEVNSRIEFSEVLYVRNEGGTTEAGTQSRVGKPLLQDAKVVGKVLGVQRGPKLIAAQFRRRKNSRRRIGHRQSYTKVLIESIQA